MPALLTSLLGGIGGYVCAAIVAAGLSGWTVHAVDQGSYQKLVARDANAQVAAVTKAKNLQSKADQIALALAVREAKAQAEIAHQADKTSREIIRYVTPKQNAQADKAASTGCITYGLVRVLYAAERGIDPASITLPASEPDDACTGTQPSELAAAIAADYADARANAEQLSSLQLFVLQNEAIK